MGIHITELGVSVAGQVTRKYSKADDETTLTVTAEQARELRDSLDTAVRFFDQQSSGEPETPAAG